MPELPAPPAAAPDPRALHLAEAVARAAAARAPLIERLLAEDTHAWRIFHGVAEGRPGLTIDRYGDVLLGQIGYDPPAADELAAVEAALGAPVVWRPRGARLPPTEPTTFVELGLRLRFQAIHAGLDPYLFLDLRPARRWLKAHAAGRRALNAFAYTGAAGLAAAAGGATAVTHLDHADRWTGVALDNAALNGLTLEVVQMDYFAAVRQWAGLPPGGRGRAPPARLKPRRFDLIVLDPPTRAVSPWGTVDLARDYESLFKPAWLCLDPGGALLATNHLPGVSADDWIARCRRCADKAGRPVVEVERVTPDGDFPSTDGQPPLKIAVFHVSA
jgi:23S rRNA (cytosine1962-C5)-methyltransferase